MTCSLQFPSNMSTYGSHLHGTDFHFHSLTARNSLKQLWHVSLCTEACVNCRHVRVYCFPSKKTKLNSVALVRERNIPTERPPLVGEVSEDGVVK
jgi:hypothetical protein